MIYNQKEFNNKLENEVEFISKKIKNLATTHNDELSDLKDNNLKQEKRVQLNIDQLNEEFSIKIDQLTEEQNSNKNSMTEELNFLKLELFDFIENRFNAMNEDKLSRDWAAEILIEAAIKMKGTSIQKELNLSEEVIEQNEQ